MLLFASHTETNRNNNKNPYETLFGLSSRYTFFFYNCAVFSVNISCLPYTIHATHTILLEDSTFWCCFLFVCIIYLHCHTDNSSKFVNITYPIFMCSVCLSVSQIVHMYNGVRVVKTETKAQRIAEKGNRFFSIYILATRISLHCMRATIK